MRVLWIHQNYVSSSNAGNCRAELIINSFVEAGLEIDLICSNETYFGHQRIQSDQELNKNFRLHILQIDQNATTIKDKKLSYVQFFLLSIKYLKKLPRADIIYCSSPPLPLILASILASLYFKSKFIIEVRDLWPSFLLDGNLIRSKLLAKILYFIEAIFYRHADYCIAVSPGFKPYLIEMGISDRCLAVAPTCENPTIISKNVTQKESWKIANNLENYFLVIYAGSMNEAYNIQLLLDAALETIQEKQDIIWLFAGNGREAYKVKQAASEQKNILYLGSLSKKEILRIIDCCDIGINSHAEWSLLETTITGKLIDYLSASVPVVSICPGIMAHIIETSGAGLTVKRDVEHLSSAILFLKNIEKADRLKIGKNGKRWLDACLPYKKMAKKIKDAILEVNSKSSFSYLKIFTSIGGALKDVLTNRSEKAILKCYGNNIREHTLRISFEDWLKEQKDY